ncbi:hypothetical protein OAM34_02860 [Alphaproteobacteria bacterium]|nr:hypothetical protein [Alphaproteobacteria bacterium]
MHTIIKIAVVSVLALFAIVGLVSISKAEVLNIELECNGKLDLIFRTFEGQNKYGESIEGKAVLRSILGLENDKEFYRSQRISIINNRLDGIFELQVDEDLIYLKDETAKQINDLIKKNIMENPIWLVLGEYDFYIDTKFEIARHTGKLTAEFKLDSKKMINHLLNQFFSEEHAEELADLSGFSFDAECKNLEEKLF